MTVEQAESELRAELPGLTDKEYRELAYLKFIAFKLEDAMQRMGWT